MKQLLSLGLIFLTFSLQACSANSPTLGWDKEFLENLGIRKRYSTYAPPAGRMDQLNAHPTSHARGKVRIADRINPVFNPEIIDGYRQRLHDGMLEYRVEVRQGVTLVSGYFLPFNSATNEVYVGSMREDIYDSKYFADLMLHNMQKVRHLPPDQGGQVSMARQAAMNMAIQQQSR